MSDELQVQTVDALTGIRDEMAEIRRIIGLHTDRITTLEDWMGVHQPWSEQGRVIINDMKADQEQALTEMKGSIAGLKSQLELNTRAHSPSAWRGAMKEVLTELLPDELLHYERSKQALEDQARGKMIRELITPKKVMGYLAGIIALLASPQVISKLLDIIGG